MLNKAELGKVKYGLSPFSILLYSLCGNMPHCALLLSEIGFTESNNHDGTDSMSNTVSANDPTWRIAA